MKEVNNLNEFKKLKFQSVIPQDIPQAVELLEKLGYKSECIDFRVDDAVEHNGICAWDDGEITEGWLDDGFEQVTLEELKEMIGENTNNEVLWLNKFTLEESYLAVGEHWRGIGWVKVPDGATFATGDKDNFVFRKDGFYYEQGDWIETDVLLKHFPEYEYLKLFWARGGVKDNVFTLERLLGCEVEFRSPFGLTVNGYISKVRNSGLVRVTCDVFKGAVSAKSLTFFTEDGDELTFDEYVAMYYGERNESN